jgi:LuxR family transcriptional regulator, maltose regulon positive regulatory protein
VICGTVLNDSAAGAVVYDAAVAALRLAEDNPRAAADALAPVLDGSASSHQVWLIAALSLESSAREALGEREAARRALERGLDLAECHGLLFPFLLHPASELLERHARQRTAHPALTRKIIGVLGGSTPAAPAAGTPAPEQLPEALSQAEARVLPSTVPVLLACSRRARKGLSPV